MLQIQIRRYTPQNAYYLQVQTSSHKQMTKRRKALENQLVEEQAHAKRDEIRAMIAQVRREQVYCVDYVPLRMEDIPPNARVRDLVRKPVKQVTVSEELYQWLLQQVTRTAAE